MTPNLEHFTYFTLKPQHFINPPKTVALRTKCLTRSCSHGSLHEFKYMVLSHNKSKQE